jgi:hypothetical protein
LTFLIAYASCSNLGDFRRNAPRSNAEQRFLRFDLRAIVHERV